MCGHCGLTGRTIAIRVGSESEIFDTKYDTHEGLACANSAFFGKALSGSWMESVDHRYIELADDDPKVFRLYLHANMLWMYPTESRRQVSPLRQTSRRIRIRGRGCRIPDSKNVMIAAMIEAHRRPIHEVVQSIHNNTPGPCAARRFCVNAYAHYKTPDMAHAVQAYSISSGIHLGSRDRANQHVLKTGTDESSFKWKQRFYHEHGGDTGCLPRKKSWDVDGAIMRHALFDWIGLDFRNASIGGFF